VIANLAQRISPRARESALVLAVAAAMVLVISVADEAGPSRTPDALAYLLGLAIAALLFARRSQPMLVLAGSVGVLLTYYGIGYTAFSPAVPLAAASYSAALAGRLLPAALIDAGLLLFDVGWQSIGDGTSLAQVVGTQTLADAAVLVGALLVGEAVRSRRGWTDEIRRRLARAEQDRERDAAQRVQQERLRIARELHDILAHTIAGIGVQAAVVDDVIDNPSAEACAALRAIRTHTGSALDELKATIGLLRDTGHETPRAPAPTLARLDDLIQIATRAGVQVDVLVDGGPRELPGTIDLAAYRIVQESLTNVVRHAHATRAHLHIRYDPDRLVVDIADDGRGSNGANGAAPAGYGLVGMRERAAAVGGDLTARFEPGAGFRVSARLPIPAQPA
jgi:signal transduction histidine kinase